MSLCCEPCLEDEEDKSYLDITQEIPVKTRKQTDFKYFVILISFFSFLVISVIVAGFQGDIRRFLYDYDSQGDICGFKNEPIDGVPDSGKDETEREFLEISEVCYYGHCEIIKKCVRTCSHGHNPLITSLCVDNSENSNNGTIILELMYSSLSVCWKEILVLCFGSICLSACILTVLRLFAKTAIRILIVIISITTIGLTTLSWTMFGLIVSQTNENHKEIVWLVVAIMNTIFTIVFFFVLIKARNKLNLIAVLFQEGAKCIKDIPMMLLQPVLTSLVTAVFLFLALLSLAYISTSGRAQIDQHGEVHFPINIFFEITSWILVFTFLWLTQFFLACQNLVISGAVSSWYFSRIKGELVNPVWRNFCVVVKHHLGSAAFGSLLLAITKFVKNLMKNLENNAKSNPFAAVLWIIVRCLLSCIEVILRILTKSAYVMLVLFGEPFCISARRAFFCLKSDSSKIAAIIGVGSFLLSTIEFIIAACTTFVGIAVFQNMKEIPFFWLPTIVVFLFSYLCTHCVFSVYEMTIDTLILCFCVDRKMNDGLEKPYYMNETFVILLNEDNKKPAETTAVEEGDRNGMRTESYA